MASPSTAAAAAPRAPKTPWDKVLHEDGGSSMDILLAELSKHRSVTIRGKGKREVSGYDIFAGAACVGMNRASFCHGIVDILSSKGSLRTDRPSATKFPNWK